MSHIIGLIGFKKVGKSTAAEYLAREHGFVRHNMKDALVAEIKQNFPDLLRAVQDVYSDPKTFYKPLVADLFTIKPPLMRALLQNYGTEVRRGDSDTYWTDQWNGKYLFGLPDKVNVVTDDVRFKNEADVIKLNGGILIRLTRPDITTGGDHASETEQLSIEADYTIKCQPGDHEHLYSELDKIINSLSCE